MFQSVLGQCLVSFLTSSSPAHLFAIRGRRKRGFKWIVYFTLYTRLGSSQPPVSLKITTKNLLAKDLTYSSNTF